MKTYNDWTESKLCFSNFFNIGDEVDEETAEAYDHDNTGKARFITIEKKSMGSNWVYTGIKPRPRVNENKEAEI